jgi:hypothetical protein
MRTEPDQGGLVYTGHMQVLQTIDYFNNTHQLLSTADEILWAGDSAGAIGAVQTANLVNDLLSPSTHFRVVSEGGWFVPSTAVSYFEWEYGIRLPYQDLATAYFDQTFSSYVDPWCAALQRIGGKPEHLCLSTSVLWEHIQPPVFYAQNIYDSVQLGILGWLPQLPKAPEFMTAFGTAMIDNVWVGTTSQPKDGVLLISCLGHCNNLCMSSTTRVNGYSYRDVLDDWYFEKDKLPHRIMDSCASSGSSQPCNPSCKSNCVIMGNHT